MKDLPNDADGFAEKGLMNRTTSRFWFLVFLWGCFLLTSFNLMAQPLPPGGGGGSGGGGEGDTDFPSYTTNQFWLEALPPGTNAFNSDPDAVTFILWETTNSASYQLQTMSSLTGTNWTPQQIFNGASGQNWTPVTFPMSGQTTLFFRAIVYSQDTTDSGLPDWWKLEYGLNPNSVSSGTNGVWAKFRMASPARSMGRAI